MADYIKREDALRAVERQIGPRRSPEQNDMLSHIRYNLLKIPAADVVEVVRCKDCKFSRELTKTEKRIWLDECRVCENPEASQSGYMIVFPEHFCDCGEMA